MLNDRDLVVPSTGITHRRSTISIATNERVYDDKYHHSNVFTLYPRSSIRKLLDNLTTYLIQNREDNMARLEGASNHKLEFIDSISVKFYEINPPTARSFIPTPKTLVDKKAIINPKNVADHFFWYTTGISVFGDELGHENFKRISKKSLKCCEQVNTNNINFPPTIKDIEFENDNTDISITISEYVRFHKIRKDDNDDENNKEGIVIKDVGVSQYALKRKHLVELLIIKGKEKTHFTTIKGVSRLLRWSKQDSGLFYCKKCYCSFKSEEKSNHSHIPLCANIENVLTTMPEKNKNDIVKFRDYHMHTMQPFMITADFDTYTDELNQIKPYSFAMFTHCIFNESNVKLTHYTGEDCLNEFFNDLTYHVNRIN